MKVPKIINIIRRNVMRFFTKNMGTGNTIMIKITDPEKIKKVLICRPNARLGNLLLITPLINEVSSTFPNAKIDLFVKGGLMPIITANYPQIDTIIELPKRPFKNLLKYLKVWRLIKRSNYDIAINVDKQSSSGRMAVKFSNSDFKFYGDDLTIEKQIDYEHIAKYPVYNFRDFLKQVGISSSLQSVALTDLKLSTEEKAHGKEILSSKFDNKKKTIAVFTYATGDKCFSEFWWTDFYALLQSKYERDYNILEILPVENVSQIRFKATSFYSRDIREIGAVIANTSLFIGGDSGIMHLANAVGTPTVGLFSVSNLKKYEPYGNNSRAIDTNTIIHKNQYIVLLDHILMSEKENL